MLETGLSLLKLIPLLKFTTSCASFEQLRWESEQKADTSNVLRNTVLLFEMRAKRFAHGNHNFYGFLNKYVMLERRRYTQLISAELLTWA